MSVNTTPPGLTVAGVRGITRGERGVLAPTCPSPRARLISVSTHPPIKEDGLQSTQKGWTFFMDISIYLISLNSVMN